MVQMIGAMTFNDWNTTKDVRTQLLRREEIGRKISKKVYTGREREDVVVVSVRTIDEVKQ